MAKRIHEELDLYMSTETEETISSITEMLSSIMETMTSVNDSMYTSTATEVRQILN